MFSCICCIYKPPPGSAAWVEDMNIQIWIFVERVARTKHQTLILWLKQVFCNHTTYYGRYIMLHKSTSLFDYSREANCRITNYSSREKFWPAFARIEQFGNPNCNSKKSRFHCARLFLTRDLQNHLTFHFLINRITPFFTLYFDLFLKKPHFCYENV